MLSILSFVSRHLQYFNLNNFFSYNIVGRRGAFQDGNGVLSTLSPTIMLVIIYISAIIFLYYKAL